MLNHQYWMEKAISKAKLQKQEVPVSALIVKDDELIAIASNKVEEFNDPTAHAEILAIKEASRVLNNWRLTNCVLYSTLEPCVMCAGAIINSRISKVIFGAYDLNCGACGSAANLFTNHSNVELIGGILEIDAQVLLKDFFALKRKKTIA